MWHHLVSFLLNQYQYYPWRFMWLCLAAILYYEYRYSHRM
jgi:hypothetical protein